MLKNHSWPGNFKQMEQVLSYLISINTSGIITEEDVLRLPDFKQNDGPFNLKEQERQLIQKALQRLQVPTASRPRQMPWVSARLRYTVRYRNTAWMKHRTERGRTTKKSDPAASNICKIRPFSAPSGTRTLDK